MENRPIVEPARPEEREAAFRLILQGSEDHESRIANALRLVELGELKESGILVVRRPLGLSGAMVCLPIPGAGALVWPPRAVPGSEQAEIEDCLARHALAWLRQCGAKLAQALLVKGDVPLAAPLERNGFRRVTSLCYMRAEPTSPPPDIGPRLDFQPYDPADAGPFHATLLRTYEGTLDCPEVTGVRDIAEIIAGHRAPDGAEMDHWWLALERDRPAGVLLLTETAGSETWEVAYVGVVPEARGRGVGRQLVLKALREARAAGMCQLSLSVDARNQPAIQLYRGLGFQLYDQREVYLAILGPTKPAGESWSLHG
jgi:ribosomal protein S18 acetylase RimI-like enzyme